MAKSIAEIGKVTESQLLSSIQPSNKKLFVYLLRHIFIRSLIISVINVIIINLIWIFYAVVVIISWIFLIESALVWIWAGLLGSVKTSLSINKLLQMVTKAEQLDRGMINKTLKSTLAYSVLGTYFFIYSVVTSSFGLHLLLI